MADNGKKGTKPSGGSAVSQGMSAAADYASRSAPFVLQSNQIAMHSVEKMINLQADVLRASFNDMQMLLESHGNPPAEVTNQAFKLIVDRSMEHVRTTLAATQEMHKAYLDLMEGYLHTVRDACPPKTKE